MTDFVAFGLGSAEIRLSEKIEDSNDSNSNKSYEVNQNDSSIIP